MNYIQVNITFQSPTEEFRNIITAELADLGYDSFIETEDGILAYIVEAEYKKDVLITLNDQYEKHIPFSFETELIEQKNWNAEWESNYEPINVENICLVKAPFHNIEGDFKYQVIIEPKMSFGTGHHETTFLMIKMMLEMDFRNKAVLDMGCGTGILAILAAMMQASLVTAIDIDTWAYENTIENARKNNMDIINAIQGDVTAVPDQKYDVILANINRNILLEDIPHYTAHLKHPGILLLSGIYQQDMPAIETKTKTHGLTLEYTYERNQWVAARFSGK